MKRTLLSSSICALLLVSCSWRDAQPKAEVTSACSILPDSLVGVWTTDDAVIRGQLLLEGVAVYLRTDGLGGVVAGPPPLGYQIYVTDVGDASLIFEMVEYGEVVRTETLTFDSSYDALQLNELTLSKRFDHLPNSTLEALGISNEDLARCGRSY